MNAVIMPFSETQGRVLASIRGLARQVEVLIHESIEALLSYDQALAKTVLERQHDIHQAGRRIETELNSALAAEQLPIDEKKEGEALLKINMDLGRLACSASAVASGMLQQSEKPQGSDHTELQPMAIVVSHNATKTLRALVHRDLLLARNVAESGGLIDSYRGYAKGRLEQAGNQDGAGILSGSHDLEQVGSDVATLAHSLVAWLDGKRSRTHAA